MIEVGDYIKTPYHKIEKIEKIKQEDGWICVTTDKNAYELEWLEENKVKHSKNIIDLIDIGDYVNGNEVLDKYLLNGEIPVLETTGDETNAKCMCEGDIRIVLTKEQYVQNCYTVERNEEC